MAIEIDSLIAAEMYSLMTTETDCSLMATNMDCHLFHLQKIKGNRTELYRTIPDIISYRLSFAIWSVSINATWDTIMSKRKKSWRQSRSLRAQMKRRSMSR